MKRKFIYLLLGLLVSLPACADFELVVELQDASVQCYQFSDEPVMSFGNDGAVTVSSAKANLEVTLEDIARFYVRVKGTETAVTPVVSDEVFTFSCQDGVVRMTGVASGSAYNLSGVLVSRGEVSGGEVTVDLRNLASGVYIIRTNNKSIKIKKQ